MTAETPIQHHDEPVSEDVVLDLQSVGASMADLAVEPEALGRLRRELIWTLGEPRAHGVLVRFGYSCGQADGVKSATAMPMLRGFGDLQVARSFRDADEHVFDLTESTEAREHIRFFGRSESGAQCWILAGYLTGAVSHALGHPIYFVETQCIAKGDAHCRLVGRSRDAWTAEGVDLVLYEEDNISLELAQTREQLRFTKDRYQTLFEQSSSPIFIVDPGNGACLNANVAAEELTGRPRSELLRMSFFDLCHQNEHRRVMGAMKDLLNAGHSSAIEVSIVRRDGLIRVIELSMKILSYGGQHVIQCVLRDITELKLSEQKEKDLQHQLMRSERLSSIGRLAAGVAHELKNPLGAIRNAVYYIRNALSNNPVLETDPHLKEILKLAESEIDGAVVIIGELLDFSRVVQLVPRRTSINEVLEKLPSIVNIPENVELVWDLDVALPSAIVDPDRLNQVFCNIVNNAAQAMPQGGRLKIGSRLVVESNADEGGREERILVSFEDTGCGIEPIHLSKIFEPLFTTKARGTGLGLAISSNIVEKHGGAILVTSQVGKGTVFTVKLPLQSPADKEAITS